MIVSQLEIERALRQLASSEPQAAFPRELRALDLSPYLSAIDSMPELRSAVVDSVRESLAEGAFVVSPEEIAEKIIGRVLADRLR